MAGAFSMILLLAVLVAVVLVVVAIGQALAPVSRSALETFVDRTGVALTTESAPLVVDGLARSRRWRTAGVLLSVALWLAWSLVAGVARIDTFAGSVVALGYALGAVVGEVRGTYARPAGPRTAGLVPRRESDYVPGWSRRLPATLALVSVVAAVVVARHHPWDAAILFAVALVTWAGGRWCTRIVVERPLPSAGADLVDADAGLRSRALHAVGAAVALVEGWAALALVAYALVAEGTPEPNSGGAVLALLLAVGWLVVSISLGVASFRVAAVAPAPVDAEETSATAEVAQVVEGDPGP